MCVLFVVVGVVVASSAGVSILLQEQSGGNDRSSAELCEYQCGSDRDRGVGCAISGSVGMDGGTPEETVQTAQIHTCPGDFSIGSFGRHNRTKF